MICDKCAKAVCEVCGAPIPSNILSDAGAIFFCVLVVTWFIGLIYVLNKL